jgi:hypothetical protein
VTAETYDPDCQSGSQRGSIEQPEHAALHLRDASDLDIIHDFGGFVVNPRLGPLHVGVGLSENRLTRYQDLATSKASEPTGPEGAARFFWGMPVATTARPAW